MNRKSTSKLRGKVRYHHGELREALIAATKQLLVERGAENFTLADACRLAGVTTAAPYRHFRDKQEVLEEIASRGFEELTRRFSQVVAEKGEGTIETIIAMGRAYVAFAVEQKPVFRLMFGQQPSSNKAEFVKASGHACFSSLIRQVSLYCQRHGIDGDAQQAALKLWSFVHGTASLAMDQKYETIAPQVDVENLLASAASGLLSTPTRPGGD